MKDDEVADLIRDRIRYLRTIDSDIVFLTDDEILLSAILDKVKLTEIINKQKRKNLYKCNHIDSDGKYTVRDGIHNDRICTICAKSLDNKEIDNLINNK